MGSLNGITQDWLSLLHSSGYKLTAPRRAIVEIMANADHALSPIDVYDIGRKEYPGLGLVTVYRTLEKLEDIGVIQRVHQPIGCNMYLRAGNGHQHILLCSKCGAAEYFGGDDLTELIHTIAARSGFEIKEHWLQFHGLCASCKEKTAGI
jgi:Fur family transcriptional regulator, ferric uptake regulator